MGGGSKELAGPDLEAGITFAELTAGVPVLGHAKGEAVVVVRVGDDVHAIGASCTHYGGPLAEGLVEGATIRCPGTTRASTCAPARRSAPPRSGQRLLRGQRAGALVQVGTKKDAPSAPRPRRAHRPS